MPIGFRTHLITKRLISVTASIILALFCFSCIYAAGYDFDKLSALARQKYGEQSSKDILELQQLVSHLTSAPETEKLKEINDFFNKKVIFADDIEIWGQTDYWATPLETIGLHAGDCEDFSIAKYMFLKAVNVPNDKLRLTYVRAELNFDNRRFVRAHMVLSYYPTPQSEPLILDSLVPDIYPASKRKDLAPVFSFNDKGIWVGNSNKPRGDAQSHLSRWRDVLSRMHEDGLE